MQMSLQQDPGEEGFTVSVYFKQLRVFGSSVFDVANTETGMSEATGVLCPWICRNVNLLIIAQRWASVRMGVHRWDGGRLCKGASVRHAFAAFEEGSLDLLL